MSKETMKLALEAGIRDCTCNGTLGCLERFAEFVRADEREKWEGQTAVEIHEAVLDEREACANVAEDSDHVVLGRGYYDQLGDADATVRNIVAAIRARTTP